jgi:acetoin utilization deacetylase AcuC-like enzyme
MSKYSRLRTRVASEGILNAADMHVPDAASWDDLALVHTAEYLDRVRTGTLPRDAQRRIGFPWSEQMVERSRRSVGATIAATRQALVGGVAANLAGGTHHAFCGRGEGYCVFNDVAVAARLLLGDHVVRRIAVVDCDVHQGNGTAAIFADDPRVFTCSIHGAGNFPFHKETSDLDFALPDRTGDAEYLDIVDEALDAVFARQDPDFVFYVAGADPYEKDRLGRLALTIDGLLERDRRVFDACAGVPVVVVMAGGYCSDVEAIVEIHTGTVRAAVEFERAALREGGREHARTAL